MITYQCDIYYLTKNYTNIHTKPNTNIASSKQTLQITNIANDDDSIFSSPALSPVDRDCESELGGSGGSCG
jgi:hypothetical protein